MIPPDAREIFLYYGAVVILGLILMFRRGRVRSGMRLRLRGSDAFSGPRTLEKSPADNVLEIKGDVTHSGYTHIAPVGERPLNVVFNFNGHSWDAYEVLGLPAGSPPERVDEVYRAAVSAVEEGSRPFLQAAYQAIQSQWKMYRAAGN